MEQPGKLPGVVQQDDGVPVKDLILKVQEFGKYLFSQWKFILLAGLVGGGLGIFYASTEKIKYTSELTFVLEDGKSNPLAAYAGIASQFGIDMGSSSGSGVFAGDNILIFLKSRLMVERALLSGINYQGHETSLAELYIQANELRESWKKNENLKKVHFLPNADRKQFNILQDSILNTIYINLLKKELSINKLDKKLGFISVKCISRNEIFAKEFVERLVKEAADFYVTTKTMRSKTNVDKLQAKADSVEALLNKKTYSIAAIQDVNLNPIRRMASVGTELATRDKMILQTMFSEVVKNLEISRMSMAQETPIIQIVDTPILPLKQEKLGRFKGGLAGGIFGGFLIVIFLVARRIYRQIMS